MTPAATRAKVIDMLKAGAKHLEICAAIGVSKDVIRHIAKRAGLQRISRHPPRLGYTPPPKVEDGTHYKAPKALKPWPAWALFGVGEAVRGQLRRDYEALRQQQPPCPACGGEGFVISKHGMDACAACAARARVQEGEKHD